MGFCWLDAVSMHEDLNVFEEDLARDQVYEFLFVCQSLKIQGATGSPIRPMAVVPQRERKDV